MNISNKKCKLELLDGSSIEFNLIPAQTADTIYQAILKHDDKPEYIEHIFNILTGNRYDIDTLYAGAPALVIYAAIIKSGVIKDLKSLISTIEENRNAVESNIYYSIYSSISRVLPQYKLDELKDKTVSELFELYAYCEKIMGKQILDTAKMLKSLDEETSVTPKKGVASVTKDEIELLQSILQNEELRSGGMPTF